MKVEDVRAIITGAAGGIGRHCCLQLCLQGAKVAALDIDGKGLEELAAQAEAAGLPPGALAICPADVSREPETVAAVERAVRQLGHVNTLINNAGIYRDGTLVRSLGQGRVLKMPLAQWDRVLAVDLTGSFLMAREVAAHMVSTSARPGLIVNISSISRAGFAGQGNYSAAKAALVADARVWSQELAVYGIRVAALAPGFIDTPILAEMQPSVLQGWIGKIPAGRLGTVEEIFAGLRFLIECEYFNGSCLEIDGGLRP